MSLYRRKGSPFWWAQLYCHGDVVRFSTGERTKVAALRKEREEAAKLEKAKNVQGRYSLATLTAKFLIWKQANNRKPESVRAMKKHIALHILPFFGEERDVRGVTVSELEDFKAKRLSEVSASTVCKELSTLRQVLRYAAEVHHVMEQALTARNPSQRYEPKYRLFTREEVADLIERFGAIKGRGKETLPYFMLMANTGMRGGELEKLTWDMVDLKRCQIFLPGEITKTRRPRTIPLNPVAMGALAMVRPKVDMVVGRVFRAKRHYNTWKRVTKEAGVWPCRPHDLRHTFGSLMHEAGVPGPAIRDILGHVTLAMENHYAHTFQEQLHQAVGAVQLGENSVLKNVLLNGQIVPEMGSKRPEATFSEVTKNVAISK